ncbi:MAG: IS66 family transposase [Provencibacterium sp.]|jgi:hypothetical protein|nr:IS66 family transposase [Provencibacterium sp.]
MRNDFPLYTTDYISGVMSLRKPQKESLKILEEIINSVQLRKDMNLKAALGAVHAMYPICSDFEREFLSLTFALATGVGKTRLMGAFIACLYTQHNIRNFFVVAPNTTIYEKLKKDLSDNNSPKYVFKGLGCFTAPPHIITDDDYREVLQADETTLQVLHELRKKAQTKSYIWLYRTGKDGGSPIVLYEYQSSLEAKHAAKFLDGFSGYLHADGYQGYHKLPENIRVVGRWAHARRKFDEALNALPPDKREGTAALAGLKYCNKLFAWEERFKNLSSEERTKQRLKEEKPILDALLAWADSAAAPKSALGKALHYLKEQWPCLLRYLEDGRLELSNNRAERSVKPFVIGRKNFLFANTPLGAQVLAVIYSLIETARETGLDPFCYLT